MSWLYNAGRVVGKRCAAWRAHSGAFTKRLRQQSALAKASARRHYAARAHKAWALRIRASIWLRRRRGWMVSAALIAIMWLTYLLVGQLQAYLAPRLGTEQAITDLKAVLVQVGGALIGATAIVSSLVLFSMQVNIERMPYGLFRWLGSDGRLILAFAMAFFAAIGVATLPMITDRSRVGVVVALTTWGTAVVLGAFLYAYARALRLVNPVRQLEMLVMRVHGELSTWRKRAERAKPLLEPAERHSADIALATFYGVNKHWTSSAETALQHTMSFAKRYAEQGDHEVATAALNAMVAINAAYIEAKGKTFFSNVPLLPDHSFSSDSLVNTTLEFLRQNVRAGITRGDEQQIEQTFRAMAALARLYLGIDYANEFASKTHAHLATGYLSSAVESVIPHNMADVLMEGARQIGATAQLFINVGRPDDIATSCDSLGHIGLVGLARKDHRPVTITAVEQLTNLTCGLLTIKVDIGFAVQEARGNIEMIATLAFAVPDSPLERVHATLLAPYYSVTSTSSLGGRLIAVINAILHAKEENEDAETAAGNIA